MASGEVEPKNVKFNCKSALKLQVYVIVLKKC